MTLKTYGKGTLKNKKSIIEITNVTPNGFWILINSKEYFVSFTDYPGFKDASLSQIFKVEFQAEEHLFWEDLDIDIELTALKHPEKYPLVYK